MLTKVVLAKAIQTDKTKKQVEIVFLDSRHSSAVQWDNPREKEIRMTYFLKCRIFPVLLVNMTWSTPVILAV